MKEVREETQGNSNEEEVEVPAKDERLDTGEGRGRSGVGAADVILW